jgi:hypothetical protein
LGVNFATFRIIRCHRGLSLRIAQFRFLVDSCLGNPKSAKNDIYRMALQILCAMVVIAPFCFDFVGLVVSPALLCWFSNCDAIPLAAETRDKSSG